MAQAEKPRVLHVIRSLAPEAGGPVEGIRRLASVAGDYYRLEVASLDEPDAPFLQELPFPVHPLGPARGTFGYSDKLTPWMREHAANYQGIVIHGLWQYHGFGTYRAIRHRLPYVAFTHGMLDPWFKKRYPLKHFKKWAYWLPFEYRMLRDARAVLFTSPLEAKLAEQSFRLHKWNPVVVPYGTTGPDVPEHEAREAFYAAAPEARGKRLLLYLSRIHPKKGCDLLIEAFARVMRDTDHVLVMAGPDQTDWKPELIALAEKHGVADRILWPGMLKGAAKWGAYYAGEAYVLPSHQENFGIVVAEALACRRAVLTTTQVNIWPDLVEANCGIVEPDTREGVENLLRRWLSTPEPERRAMEERGAALFAERFNMRRLPQAILRELGLNYG